MQRILEHALSVPRLACRTSDAGGHEHVHPKSQRFTGRADMTVVSEMYEGFISTAAPDIDTLDFRGLMWKNLQCLQAAKMLIHFQRP